MAGGREHLPEGMREQGLLGGKDHRLPGKKHTGLDHNGAGRPDGCDVDVLPRQVQYSLPVSYKQEGRKNSRWCQSTG